MDPGHLFLLLLFVATIFHLVTLKLCSLTLDHRTAPLFISGWTLAGLAATVPVFGHLWAEGWAKLLAAPGLLLLAAAKGVLLYYLFVVSQKLMQVSLSSRHYVTPLSVGLLTGLNYLLGEQLTAAQLFSCLGLCLLAAGFFFRGHLADMGASARRSYLGLVVLSALLGTADGVIVGGSNWYAGLWVSNLVLLLFSLGAVRGNVAILRQSFMTRAAALAGFFYMATELVKFYQMVTINPVSVIVTVQAMTKPVILVLSALIWHERTVKEQLLWGVAAFVVTLPLFF